MAWPSSASPRQPSRAVSIRKVVLYHAEACHLCERARAILEQVGKEADFELHEIDIAGDPELEAQYREWLPVVEIDGERAFVYYVDPDAFRRKIAAQS
jgi:glutaredoxin